MVNRFFTPETQSAKRVFKLIVSVLYVFLWFNSNAITLDFHAIPF